jgi:hypothetical protein
MQGLFRDDVASKIVLGVYKASIVIGFHAMFTRRGFRVPALPLLLSLPKIFVQGSNKLARA